MRLLLLTLLGAAACTASSPKADEAKNEVAGPSPSTAADEQAPPKPPTVRDDSKNLVLSWYDPKQGFVTGTSAADVPPESRKDVVVADLSRSPKERQASRYVMIADLSERQADGSYPVVVQSRYQFSGADLSDLGPMPKNDGVIVYSTSWCGPCKALKKWLTSEGIPFESKDVEHDAGAAQEMTAKLEQAGMQGGGVPVVDVRGTMIKGFNKPAIVRALKKPHD